MNLVNFNRKFCIFAVLQNSVATLSIPEKKKKKRKEKWPPFLLRPLMLISTHLCVLWARGFIRWDELNAASEDNRRI